MTTQDITTILVAIARVEGRLDSLQAADTTSGERLEAHSHRLDKLERLAYVALGMAVASGLPQVLGLLP
jgi:hypothetical protein